MPPVNAFPDPTDPTLAASDLRPVPFEDREALPGFWKRLGETCRLAFGNPMAFYARVPASTGLSAPWRLLLLFSLPIYLFLSIYAVFGAVMALVAAFSPTGEDRLVGMLVGGCLSVFLFLLPFLQFLGLLVAGTLNHVCLWLWGALRGSPHGLHQTIRATAYTQAFLGLLSLIPLVGLFAGVAGWILLGAGLARLHRTETWRGICALATPLVLGVLLLMAALGTVLGLALHEEFRRQSPRACSAPVLPPEPPPTVPDAHS